MDFVIYGETPSKKNSKILTRNRHIPIPNEAHKKWHTDAMIQLNAQLGRMNPKPNLIETPISIKITFIHGDQRRRDSDNQVSSIMDLLQDAKILADDKWQIVREICINNLYEKNEAKCKIEIKDYKV